MPWISKETITPTIPVNAHAGTLPSLNFSCTVAIGASYKLINDVIPASNTATKKMIAISHPPGIPLIRFGRKMNNSPGPP